MKKIIHKSDLIAVVEKAYEKYKGLNEGKKADYIPYLSEIDDNLFGISVVLADGSIIERGNTDYLFGIESISKVHNTILILKQYGADKLINRLGANATGMPFNSIMAILLENDQPEIPLVNSGAISTVSMVKPLEDIDAKWQAIVDNMTALCGSGLSLINELYESESESNYNNRSIAWLLKSKNKMYDDPMMSLDLYTRSCSMGVTASQLAISGATIAFGGKNPVTGVEVFESFLTPKIVSLIATVGFYEQTGFWMYTAGIPAKTGVGGGIMGVLPNTFGIAAFSPLLDSSGNSVRAQAAIKYIANTLGINIFDGNEIEVV